MYHISFYIVHKFITVVFIGQRCTNGVTRGIDPPKAFTISLYIYIYTG